MSDALGLLRRAVGPLVEPFYRAEVARRSRAFDLGRGVERLDLPVLSVGNLTTGGTGKSPMVAWLVRRLLEAGQRPLIAMRGYRRDAHGRSDEADEYARTLAGVPVVARADRAQGVREHLELEKGQPVARTTCVVLDDGFQHRRLARQLDIVLLDSTRDVRSMRLLPMGDLREPLSALARADAIVLTRWGSGRDEADARAILRDTLARAGGGAGVDGERAPSRVLAACDHAWLGLRVDADGVSRDEPVQWLRGRRVLAVCAIGNPGPFMAQVGAAVDEAVGAAGTGAAPVASIVLPDHDPYSSRTIARIVERARAERAEAIVTTEKDWSKLSRRGSLGCPVVRPVLGLRFAFGEDEMRARAVGVASGATSGRGAAEGPQAEGRAPAL